MILGKGSCIATQGSGFLLTRSDTPVPLRNSLQFNKHILYQIFDTYKFLFFNDFLKIEHDKVPNFALSSKKW